MSPDVDVISGFLKLACGLVTQKKYHPAVRIPAIDNIKVCSSISKEARQNHAFELEQHGIPEPAVRNGHRDSEVDMKLTQDNI